jgi:poly(A) polymerase
VSDGLEVVRRALAGRSAWLVGGAVRDRALGRGTDNVDVDVVVEGDPAEAARAVAGAAGRAPCFALSERFGAWRVVARDRSWQVDVEPLRAQTLADDLALRDFTVNAIAEPITGGAPIDPLGGLADLSAGRLRMAGPDAFADDPLRVLRLVRVAVELGLEPERDTLRMAGAAAGRLDDVSAERVFMELRRIVAAPRAVDGLQMSGELGVTEVVLPELVAMEGVQQSRFHHLDVFGHTLEVLQRAVELTTVGALQMPALQAPLGQSWPAVARLLAEPLADEMSRGEALRWGALLHDVAKPLTREVRGPQRRVTFIGHDVRGADVARSVLARLRASERLRAHVAALVRNHLRLGFLVHEPQPLARRSVFAYLRACSPVEVDVTMLSVLDRLATRGEGARDAIDAHVRLAESVLEDALAWHEQGPPAPLLRGDELAGALGIATGPRVGQLLDGLAEAQYAGEVTTRDQAIAYAHAMIANL